MNDLDEVLLNILGSKDLVDEWWRTPNKDFELKTPLEIWGLQPEKVARHVMNTYYRLT